MKVHPIKPIMLASFIAASTFMVPAAHAGIFNLTFREDQKPSVTPPYVNKPIPPRYERGMYYDKAAGSTWTNYYTRPDLEIADGLDGASKVMRIKEGDSYYGDAEGSVPEPMTQPKWQRAAPANEYYQQNPHQNFGYGYGPAAIPPGYQAMAWRMYMNQLAEAQNNTMIAEPGALSRNGNSTFGEVGVKTTIGQPVHPWDAQPAQPIDYNTLLRRQMAHENSQITLENGDNPEMQRAQQMNAAMNPQGVSVATPEGVELPMDYVVQQGDTLSTISQQPQIYADWSMWPLIYDANQPALTDPDLLYPAQSLGIPRDYSAEDASSARQRARNKQAPISLTDGQ